MNLRALGAALIVALLTAALAGCNSPAPAAPGAEIVTPPATITPLPTMEPRMAPDLTLTMLDGEETSLEAWRGKGVILNFWATWCYPCRTEMPLLAEIHTRYEDIVVIGVNYLENRESAAGFVRQFDIPFPIVLDEKGWLSGELGVRALPTTVYIDASGQIVGSKIGPVTEAEIEALIPDLLP